MWMHVPSMVLPSVPGPEDLISDLDSLCRDFARACMWNTKPAQWQSWQRALRTAPWMMRLSGAIYAQSTLHRGVERWISSLVASPASRGASRAGGGETTTRGTSGRPSSDSFSPSALDGYSWKMWGDSFGMDTDALSSPTLNALATGLRRSSSRLRTSGHRTAANGSLSSPTATAEDAESSGARRPGDVTLTEAAKDWPTPSAHKITKNSKQPTRMKGEAGDRQTALADAADLWQTPNGQMFGSRKQVGAGEREPLLAGQAQMWSTPRSNSATGAGDHGNGGPDLQTQTFNWPTPQAVDMPNTNANQKNMPPSLGKAAGSWGSPKARDWKGGGFEGDLSQQAEVFRSSLPLPTTGTDGDTSSNAGPASRRRLNPMFVEWLMGWPLGWTSLAPLGSGSPETALCRYRQRMRTAFFALDSTNSEDRQ